MQTDNPARAHPQAHAPAHAQAAICPRFHYAVELIGRRWTGAILRALLDGATRFTDVTYAVPGLSDRLLSERLRELESEAIVTRTVIPEMPVRVEYQLTEKGRALESVMAAIGAWATEWVELPEDAEACAKHGDSGDCGC